MRTNNMRLCSLVLVALLAGCSSQPLLEQVSKQAVPSKEAALRKKVALRKNAAPSQVPQAGASSRGVPESVCPPGVSAQLNGFFRWYLNSQGHYRDDFASQQQRFLPRLFEDLRKGLAMLPANGEGLTFDPFSGSQLASFNYWIGGCRVGTTDTRLARLAVLSGRSRKTGNWQVVDYVLAPVGSNCLIADLLYPEKGNLSLMQALSDLSNPQTP
ncbi:MAG: hypothetical protein AB8B70_11955 [Prochlorococcus sp.]